MPSLAERAPDASGAYYETYWSEDGYNPVRDLPSAVQEVLASLVDVHTACLDVGCGDGRTEGRWLSQRAGSYVGVDISHVAVDTARSLGLDARVIDDASSLPFASNSFDLVVCLEVLEHMLEPLQAAQEISRVLKPGGVLVASVPNLVYWQRRLELLMGIWNPLGDDQSISQPWRDPHIRFFSPASLGAMLGRAGFTEVAVGAHDGTAWTMTIPWLRRVRGLGLVQPFYDRCQRRWPAACGLRLHAVAVAAH